MSKLQRQEIMASIIKKANEDNELAELKKLCLEQLQKILELKKIIEQN